MLRPIGLPKYVRISVMIGIVIWGILNLSILAQSKKAASSESIDVTINVPRPIEGGHLLFGIPLGSVKTPNHVSVYDDTGNYLEADVFPLQNWQSQNARWALIAMPISDTTTGYRALRIAWDQLNPPFEAGIQLAEMSSGEMAIVNRYYDLRLTSQGISAISTPSAQLEKVEWAPGIHVNDEPSLRRAASDGKIIKLYNGSLYKKIRTESTLGDGIIVHQEFDFFANSPYIKCQTRFINTSSSDIHLAGIHPLDVKMEGVSALATGLANDKQISSSEFTLHQGKQDWLLSMNDQSDLRGKNLFTHEWATLKLNNDVEIQWIFPDFQEMAAAHDDRESIMSLKNGHFYINHYQPLYDGSEDQVLLRKGMARTFTHWMIFSPQQDEWISNAATITEMPHIQYDLEYLASAGISVNAPSTTAFDDEITQTQKSFLNIPASTSIPEISNTYKIGGMSYGLYRHVHNHAGLIETYDVNSDLTLGLIHAYLSTSDPKLANVAYKQALLQADWGILHSEALSGQGFEYDNPVNYGSFEGLILAYSIWGDPWLMESAKKKAMALSGPQSQGVSRGDAVATRSLSTPETQNIKKQSSSISSLVSYADLTGEAQFMQSAVQMVSQIQQEQESSGTWSMNETGADSWEGTTTTAKIGRSLWPLYFRFKDESLRESLLEASRWILYQQAELSDKLPGMFMDEGEYAPGTLPGSSYTVTATMAEVLQHAFMASKDNDYFYASNAAWFSLMNQLNRPSGAPFYGAEIALTGLPEFAHIAESQPLPALISAETLNKSNTEWLGMGNQTSWDGKKFIFDLKWYGNPENDQLNTETEVVLDLYFPFEKPGEVLLNGKQITFEFIKESSVLTCTLPLQQAVKVYRVEVNTKGA